jgi:hypothetical protein
MLPLPGVATSRTRVPPLRGGPLPIAPPAVFVPVILPAYCSGAARLRGLVPPGRAGPADAARPGEEEGQAAARQPGLVICSDAEYGNNF